MWQSRDLSRQAPSDAESSVSAYSLTSNFRHSGNFNPTQQSSAIPKLTKDASHKPKTHGSFGVLVVGLGGANGTTMLGKWRKICKISSNLTEWHPQCILIIMI
jgi:hypothetical protein